MILTEWDLNVRQTVVACKSKKRFADAVEQGSPVGRAHQRA
jgi:hypothetical protein